MRNRLVSPPSGWLFRGTRRGEAFKAVERSRIDRGRQPLSINRRLTACDTRLTPSTAGGTLAADERVPSERSGALKRSSANGWRYSSATMTRLPLGNSMPSASGTAGAVWTLRQVVVRSTRLLADRVGETGSVLATELEPGLLAPLGDGRVQVLRHDLLTDPLPSAAFDLAHTRLLPMFLPSRLEALRRIAATVRPGGWVAVIDVDFSTMRVSPTDVAWDPEFGRPSWTPSSLVAGIHTMVHAFLTTSRRSNWTTSRSSMSKGRAGARARLRDYLA